MRPLDESHRDDLDLALAAAAETNRVIAATDVKGGLLLAAQGLVVSITAPALTGSVVHGVARVGAAGAVVMATLSVVMVLAVLWPRLTAATSSWFAFSVFPRPDEPLPARPPAATLADQAWRQVGALAAITRRKTVWLRSATAVGGASLLTLAMTGALALLS